MDRNSIEEQKDVDMKILEGLKAGLTDSAIARKVAYSDRSVRRRVAELMQIVGAHTRFEMALMLVRNNTFELKVISQFYD